MKKSFDCVDMKNRLQEAFLEDERRLGPDEARRRRQRWLATDEAPLASWWRSLKDTAGDSCFSATTHLIGNDGQRPPLQLTSLASTFPAGEK